MQESLKAPAHVWKSVVAGDLQDALPEALSQITVPTLLVWGDRDVIVPRSDQDAQMAAIAASELAVYEGAGHGVHWEEHVQFARHLVRFTRTVAG